MSKLTRSEIDLSNIENIHQLHELFTKQPGFPEFYGKNWDAFWDSITVLVEMPTVLTLKGWNYFEDKFPRDGRILKETIEEFNKINSEHQIEIV